MVRGRREKLDMTAWLAKYLLGPASVAPPQRPGRPATDAEREREQGLQAGFERVQDAAGRTYLVDRSTRAAATPDAPPDPVRATAPQAPPSRDSTPAGTATDLPLSPGGRPGTTGGVPF